ncbi:response regulator [Sandaracinus amylolyticus]|uniref:Response regulatory domain-containing protein n=1 Tax=Sandaracinus amylolyticus TaxID=927083 RepID=A0A0F6W437_9BACT|nr:response regulator [Sandaracinus amylolyticus]AKF06987.1 hypothetical protein DB32_004136 [Sandaracinus amylolyticus]
MTNGDREPAPLAWKTVMLVENDEPLRALGVQILQLAGAEVIACDGAEQARVVLADAVPDYVITDVELPDDGGRALARELRAQPDLQGVFVVALAPPSLSRASLDETFDAVIEKPSGYEHVVTTLGSLVLPDDAAPRRVRARVADRVFLRDGGDSLGLVQLVRDEGFVAHVERLGPTFVPADAVAARHEGKVLLDLSRLDDELRAGLLATDQAR